MSGLAPSQPRVAEIVSKLDDAAETLIAAEEAVLPGNRLAFIVDARSTIEDLAGALRVHRMGRSLFAADDPDAAVRAKLCVLMLLCHQPDIVCALFDELARRHNLTEEIDHLLYGYATMTKADVEAFRQRRVARLQRSGRPEMAPPP